MNGKRNWLGNLQDRKKDIRLTMLYKIKNEIAKVPNKEIVIPADTRNRNNYGQKCQILTKNTKHIQVEMSFTSIS